MNQTENLTDEQQQVRFRKLATVGVICVLFVVAILLTLASLNNATQGLEANFKSTKIGTQNPELGTTGTFALKNKNNFERAGSDTGAGGGDGGGGY